VGGKFPIPQTSLLNHRPHSGVQKRKGQGVRQEGVGEADVHSPRDRRGGPILNCKEKEEKGTASDRGKKYVERGQAKEKDVEK